jgi:energy-coupling factor transport system ATP-binding protein
MTSDYARVEAEAHADAVHVANLRLKYPGAESLIFQGLNFSVKQGEKVLLLGPSGCGKSTLLQVLSGLIPNTVEVPMRADRIRTPERPGYMFQDPDTQFCMPYTDEEIAFVLENLAVPRDRMPALIERYVSMVGLRLADLHTPIQQLSQGMKQRLAIASMLALEPEVWFLDEPTALLDEEGTREVWETIRSVAADKTVVIVEHKIGALLDWVDRVVVFAPDGGIVADGRPEDMFREYRRELREYGIWYPGVWDDYEAARIGAGASWPASAAAVRDGEDTLPQGGRRDQSAPAPVGTASIAMEQFRGWRGREAKVEADGLAVYPGEWIAVVGRNGAGKSSLLLSIMRLLRTTGTCAIEGRELPKAEQLAARIGFVFQNPEFQFVTGSVREELGYSLQQEGVTSRELQERVDLLLRDYELEPLRDRHPYQLSMGQKRRLSVATAMVRGQRILLLDEPTFGLDARHTFLLLDRLERLRAAGTAIVMVTHDPEIAARFATRVWRVEAGRVSEAERQLPRLPGGKEAELVCN